MCRLTKSKLKQISNYCRPNNGQLNKIFGFIYFHTQHKHLLVKGGAKGRDRIQFI